MKKEEGSQGPTRGGQIDDARGLASRTAGDMVFLLLLLPRVALASASLPWAIYLSPLRGFQLAAAPKIFSIIDGKDMAEFHISNFRLHTLKMRMTMRMRRI
jgi:hypothetical protein